ncbi:MAG: O-antigen ligase family protein, partial [Fimbriimonadales bacterium]
MRRVPLVLASVSVFLAALIGGQVPVDAQPLSPDVHTLVAALSGSPEVPVLSWFVFALFGLAALALSAAAHRVLQMPKMALSVVCFVFATLLVLAVPTSPFRMAAVVALAGWLTALAGLWIAVAVAGRSSTPRVLLVSLWSGTVLQACLALLEYGSMRAVDPSWRVFGTWVNPNALAALLQIGWLLGLALLATAPRPWNLAAFAGQAVLGLALLLTQSKGVFLTAGFGTLVYLAAVVAGRSDRPSRLRAAAMAIAAVALLGVLGWGLRATQPASGATALSRVARAEQTSEQSSGFRLLLWQGAIRLAAQHPAGIGLGAYRFRSAEPGLTTQTFYAHNSYLQLAAEASWLAAVALVALLLGWIVEALKAIRRVPWDHAVWRSSVFGAVLSVAAHSLIDSDLHYVGVGYLFFVLLGVGLAMAPDGVAPELTPRWMRVAAIAKPALFVVLLGLLGWQRALVARAVGLASAGSREEARSELQRARSMAPFDAESAYLLGQLEPPGPGRERWFREAAR